MSTMFPKWTNQLPTMLLGGVLGGLSLVIGLVWYYATPAYWEVGYMPEQPGAGYNHQIHVGKLGMDCRYCHTHVEESWHANIPTVATCINCHAEGRLSTDINETQGVGAKTQFIRDAYDSGQSIPWRQIHKLPDYVRFPHHVHVNAGVSCYSCHGQIGRMDVVHQVEPLSMGWCLECHRNPTPSLVDTDVVDVTDLFAVEKLLNESGHTQGMGAAQLNKLQDHDLHWLPENCGACHY